MTTIEAVGWVLLHFLWQGTLIALLLAALLALTAETWARLRYAMSCAALVAMLIAVVTTTALLVTGARPEVPVRMLVATAAGDIATRRPVPSSGTAGEANILATVKPATPAATASAARRVVDAAMPYLVWMWMAGVLVLSVRLLGGWWGARTLRIVGTLPAPDWCHARLETLSARLGVTRPVAIVTSIRLSVPVVLGHVKPVIVLPAAALAGLTVAQVEAVIAHELAHVRRHDYLVNLAQIVIETLLFYHPAVWWVSRQVRVTREHCCDDLAVSVCRSRHEYVHALLGLEELRGTAPAFALGATDGSLLARGRRLLVPSTGGIRSARLAASVIALTIVGAAAVSATLTSAALPDRPAPLDSAALATAPTEAARNEAHAQGGQAAVVTAPDGGGSLASRWAWAEQTARAARQRRYWVGYSITPVKTLPATIYMDRTGTVLADKVSLSGQIFSSDAHGLQFPGRPLAIAGPDRSVKILFELESGRGEPALATVHASSLSLPVRTQDLPIYWLGTAAAAESLARVDRLYDAERDANLKHDLVVVAGMHDDSPAVVTWLERRLASQDTEDIRAEAAEWIAYHPIARSLETLERTARKDRSSRVRQEAAEAVGDLAMPEATQVLIDLAKSLTDLDARREAVEALGARPELEARDALVSIARQDSEVDIQREAVETLGDFEDRRGVTALVELARTHPNVDVRREAIETLGDTMPKDAAVPLLEKLAIDDPDPDVQHEAVDTLGGFDDAQSFEKLIQLARSHPSSELRREAAEALGQRGHHDSAEQSKVVELLASLARTDRDPDVQVEATETLGEVGGAAALAQLRSLAESHRDERVRSEAIETLGEQETSGADVAAFLQRRALAEPSSEVQNEIIETLAQLHGGSGIPALIELARDLPSGDARRRALETLLESEHPAARAVFDRALGKKPVEK